MALPRCSAARAGLKIGRARRPTQATRAAWGRRPPQRQSRRDWNVPRPLPSRRRPADCDAKAHGCPSTAQTLPNSTRLTSTHGDQRRERSESFRAKFMGVGVQGRVPPKVIPNAARRVRIPPSPQLPPPVGARPFGAALRRPPPKTVLAASPLRAAGGGRHCVRCTVSDARPHGEPIDFDGTLHYQTHRCK